MFFWIGFRPIFGLDGCFLKDPFGGQLPSAIGRNGNGKMYPIALAVVEAEMYDSLKWFLNELRIVIGIDDGVGWTFISDRQKRLICALEEEVPGAEKGWYGERCYCKMVGRGLASTSYAIGTDTGSPVTPVTPVDSTQQGIGKQLVGPAKLLARKCLARNELSGT
ncbi:hypothetical protein ACH5RR_026227 [Cinchona calisaya]|uniref:MULE transposase domain-containing protein n=1 Tax=Cinchona calisaya TaxID=153742 RepID=A0ABD2Z5D9_9GENT